MEAKEIVDLILKNECSYNVEIANIKTTVETLLRRIILDTKNAINSIPDKDTFMKVLGEFGDRSVDFTKALPGIKGEIAEKYDDKAFFYAGKYFDKIVLVHLLGENWYQELVNWINGVLNEIK